MTFLIAATLTGCFGEYEPNPYADSNDWPISTETGAGSPGTESGDTDTGDSADTADTSDTAAAGPPAPHQSLLTRLLAWAGI